MSAPGGVCLLGGLSALGGVSAPEGSAPRGVSPPVLPGGLLGGVYPSMH